MLSDAEFRVLVYRMMVAMEAYYRGDHRTDDDKLRALQRSKALERQVWDELRPEHSRATGQTNLGDFGA